MFAMQTWEKSKKELLDTNTNCNTIHAEKVSNLKKVFLLFLIWRPSNYLKWRKSYLPEHLNSKASGEQKIFGISKPKATGPGSKPVSIELKTENTLKGDRIPQVNDDENRWRKYTEAILWNQSRHCKLKHLPALQGLHCASFPQVKSQGQECQAIGAVPEGCKPTRYTLKQKYQRTTLSLNTFSIMSPELWVVSMP